MQPNRENLSLEIAKGTVPCAVDREMALTFLGHRGQELDADLAHRLEAMAQRCERENNPRYLWRVLDPSRDTASQELGGVERGELVGCVEGFTPRADGASTRVKVLRFEKCALELPGNDIAAHVAGAVRVAFLVVTLGSSWQQTLEELSATSPTDALLYDACASAATEGAANAAHALLAQAAHAEGLEARARFSPGYGDLSLSVHPAFLSALDATRQLGVFVTESNLLAPAKSITAIVGLFEPGSDGLSGAGEDAQCKACPANGYCNFREKGTTCHG